MCGRWRFVRSEGGGLAGVDVVGAVEVRMLKKVDVWRGVMEEGKRSEGVSSSVRFAIAVSASIPGDKDGSPNVDFPAACSLAARAAAIFCANFDNPFVGVVSEAAGEGVARTWSSGIADEPGVDDGVLEFCACAASRRF
jgi:hypothetical protein